jgi:SM-20-related protein
MEFRGVRRLVQMLMQSGALVDTEAREFARTVDPSAKSSMTGSAVDAAAGGAEEVDGFCAHCGGSARKASELRGLVASLLTRGFAVSTSALPDASILAAAEREAKAMHAAGGMLFKSSVKNTNAHRYADPSSRGDVIRWLDGCDPRFPACSVLTQWLRGELMDAVREACDTAPPRSNVGCGEAASIAIEPHTNLPLAMLACYPGGGARFKRHVDNSPEAADLRVCTAILYLNGDWAPDHGGALRVYHGVGEDYVEVEPRRGTLAIFWSHRVPHEVMPASRTRFAISVWMSVDPQRQQAGWLGGRTHLTPPLPRK